ncbi:BTAD domain-containing putative transcriptional regulator [Actinoplanes solisilvae]|uniref:BTAD domain-containing putative transcriptional regulator n=1 Tax=Actinoplanes solisilvae TaxID=2486853 RepID=UPI000FD71D2C|nr:BTAD domain-containing putative transcriptional regulator [Actinoplanes solisilvae]
MRVSVLGQLTVTDDEGAELPAGELPRRARQVLAVLAARHGRIQSKDALADAVWGDELPGNHVAALEHYVSVVRRRLQPDGAAASWFIVTRSGGYVFDTARAELDLCDLRRLIRELETLPPGGPERLALHGRILELGQDLPFAEDPYADWAGPARGEAQAAAVAARLELSAAALDRDASRSLRLATEAIELDPFLEPAYKAAMNAAMRLDHPEDALRLFERCRKVLDEDLGVSPSADLVRLHREVLGRRRPEPDRAITPKVRPAPLERFLGRTNELRVLVDPDPPRVVHIVGPEGSGKSAYLDEVARHLVDRVGVGRAGSSIAVHRLAWLRSALVQLGASKQLLELVDAAPADRPLGRAELETVSAILDVDESIIIAVDDACSLDPASVAELSWLSQHCPALSIVLAYDYPSQVAALPLSALGSPIVLRLAPLSADDLGDAALAKRTGGIPALVAVAQRPDEIARSVAMQIARARTRWMPEQSWDLLRHCAVLGDLTAGELAELTDRPLAHVLICIDRLVHAHLLAEGPNGEVGHRSSLIRDAVADQVSGASSRALRELLAASAAR